MLDFMTVEVEEHHHGHTWMTDSRVETRLDREGLVAGSSSALLANDCSSRAVLATFESHLGREGQVAGPPSGSLMTYQTDASGWEGQVAGPPGVSSSNDFSTTQNSSLDQWYDAGPAAERLMLSLHVPPPTPAQPRTPLVSRATPYHPRGPLPAGTPFRPVLRFDCEDDDDIEMQAPTQQVRDTANQQASTRTNASGGNYQVGGSSSAGQQTPAQPTAGQPPWASSVAPPNPSTTRTMPLADQLRLLDANSRDRMNTARYLHPWWEDGDDSKDFKIYLIKTQLAGAHREGILPDTGAHDNLVGNLWVQRVTEILKQQNMQHLIKWTKLPKPITISGVGAGAQMAYWKVTIPTAFLVSGEHNLPSTYTAPVIGDDEHPSRVPALLGIKSMKKNRTVIDLVNGEIHVCGPGDVRMDLPHGTVTFKIEEAPSGHPLLPCTEYQLQKDKLDQIDLKAASRRSGTSFQTSI